MITVATAENALKNIYLDTVISDINHKTNPFLTMVEENARVASGKDAKFAIRCGASSVGVGTETGDLPTAGNNRLVEISTPLKNLYGTFEISDKALKAASLDPNAFASLLSGEMQNLVSAAQNNLQTMLYGNGKKLLAVVDASAINSSDRSKITLRADQVANFTVNSKVQVLTGGGSTVTDPLQNYTVSSINTSTRLLTLSRELPANKADRVYFYAVQDDGTAMNGIDTVFGDRAYGYDFANDAQLAPYRYVDGGNDLHIIDEDAALDFLEGYEEHCQAMPADIILMHPRVKKSIFESLKSTRANIASAELAGGFHGFTFNGIPVYSDVKCKAGTMYALNSKSFAMYQLCDWTWLANEDGSILKQQPGKASYMATLVKYADLICEKPFLQGKAGDFSALRWK